MFSAIFDVAVGLITLFIILSSMASGLSEALNNALQTRARMLKDFVSSVLHESGMLVDEFYKNTLIAPHSVNGRPPAYIEAVDFVEALFSLLRQHSPTQSASGGVEMTIDELKNVIIAMNDSAPLKQILASVIAKGSTDPQLKVLSDDVSKTKASLEQWYNTSMSRVSDRFKRRTQFILVVIGMVVAFGFNVDTISVTNALLQSPALRSAIAAQAGVVQSSTTLTFQQLNNELTQLNLPVGWPDPMLKDTTPSIDQILLKIVGLLITVFAVSQGAPFWFDMLNRITNLRTSTKPETPPPPPSPTQPSLPASAVPAVPVVPYAPAPGETITTTTTMPAVTTSTTPAAPSLPNAKG